MIFYRISELTLATLMLATLIQRYDENHFISRTRDKLKFYRLSGAPLYDCIIPYINSFFFLNKMSVFEEHGTFKKKE